MAKVLVATKALAIVGLLATSPPLYAQSPQVMEDPYCKVESETVRRLDAPPRNAAAFRAMAKRHPRKRHEFGPPPSQRDFPGSVWDLANEFWYRSSTGDLLLYCNTDDGEMYRWVFRLSGGKFRLVEYGVRQCSGPEDQR